MDQSSNDKTMKEEALFLGLSANISYFLFPILLLPLFLTACGFTPMYGHNDVSATFDQVEIGNIPNYEGQYLRNALIDRLYQNGYPHNPRYAMNLSPIEERITDLDITKSADATRAQLRVKTTMTLVDKESNKKLLERELMAMTSYNRLTSYFTTRVSEKAARENALDDLARQAERELALYFNRNGE